MPRTRRLFNLRTFECKSSNLTRSWLCSSRYYSVETYALPMLSVCCLWFFLAAPDPTSVWIHLIAQSGRVQEIAVPLSERLSPPPEIPPGAPPILSFRLFEGQSKQRYRNLDLVMDDAGH